MKRAVEFPRDLQPFFSGHGDIATIYKSGPGTQALLAAQLLAAGQDVALIVPTSREWYEMRALLSLFIDPARLWSLPEHLPGEPDRSRWAVRMAALHGLVDARGARCALVTVDNLLAKWPPRQVVESVGATISRGDEVSLELLLEQAVDWGYERVGMVADAGELSVRGDILDIFAPGRENPLRIEFFGDTVDSIRTFDPSTQRSKEELDEALILPAAPAVLTEALANEAREKWRHLKITGRLPEKSRHALEARLEASDARIHPGLYYANPAALADYIPKDAVFILASAGELREKITEAEYGWRDWLELQAQDKDFVLPPEELVQSGEQARKTWLGKRQIVFEDLTLGERKSGVDLPEKQHTAFEDIFWKPQERQRPWNGLVVALKTWRDKAPQTILSFHSARSRAKFIELAKGEEISPHLEYSLEDRGLSALVSPLRKGFELDWAQVRILPEDVLHPGKGTTERAGKVKDFKGLKSTKGLAEGELLVHRDFGVARFVGLTRLKLGDVANDYLLLHFDGDDKLYVPVDRIKVVQRFKGGEGVEPSLDSLRGTRWARTKANARKAIEKIARELVEMYAYRKIAKGFAYGPPSEMYREFEAGFGFEETPDQDKAIRDVLDDMQKDEPMDRLVCGDVGYGKTEVAMRAAFRAVTEGKQVALLCPTTVLAEQHYLNFKNRMQGFPINIAMLSRFVPRQKQTQVVRAAARGQVDVLIGTHRMLSKDVELPSLGLLVLDEEQRFGVKHKERLKELRKNVDSLTLTATPIPRTLQLSLSGIRSLSIIETPPVDRKPVETALIEEDKGMLKMAIERELARGGQVFYVHNRVKSLDAAEEYIRELAPEARVGKAHGQMSERALEETMHLFWHGELDVLVCTAIIESGLDFPNANTLIVDRAHMFGLGQLYQLRGRVGRSERQAYAYFVVPSLDGLPEVAKKRLRVILDMDYLGAGFQVAMEDLRLRGAGNILGEAQSGQIARVGLDLYLEMLEEEVRRLKGEEVEVRTEPEINFVFPAHIPEDYIADPDERLEFYKDLSEAETEAQLDDTVASMRDRFGPLPQEAAAFVAVLELKQELARLGVDKADLFGGRVVVSWAEDRAPAPETVLDWLQTRADWAKLLPPGKLELRFEAERPVGENLAVARQELAELEHVVPA